MMAGQQAALGELPRLHPRPGSDGRRTPARNYLSKAGISGKGMLDFFKSCRTRNIGSRSTRQGQLRPDPPAVVASASRRWSRSSKSDPAWNKPTDPALEARFQRVKAKLLGFVDPKHAVHQISRKRPEHPGALCPRLRLSPRRLSRQSGCRKPTPCLPSDPARSLLPRAQGPDPARRRQAGGSDRAACAKRRSGRATRR